MGQVNLGSMEYLALILHFSASDIKVWLVLVISGTLEAH